MQRPSEHEFLRDVLKELDSLPEGLADRLAEIVGGQGEGRAEAIRKLFEDAARG